MATTTSPAGVSTESSTFTTIISVVALIAIVALIYFIARGRSATPTSVTEKQQQPQTSQQQQPGTQP